MDEDLQEGDDDEEIADQKEDEDLKMKADEEMARSRQTYDPVEGIYDDRKRRVTDLKECSRVHIPKTLPPSMRLH